MGLPDKKINKKDSEPQWEFLGKKGKCFGLVKLKGQNCKYIHSDPVQV